MPARPNPDRRHPEFEVHRGMIRRCHDPRHRVYCQYGARGIRVCGEWRGKDGFKRFFAHVGPRPSAKHSIDRFPNNNGNYEPGNVRWATTKEQNRNTSRNVYVTIGNETLPLSEWVRRSGLSDRTVRRRWEDGVTGPALIAPRCPSAERGLKKIAERGTHKRIISFRGQEKTLSEWSRQLGLDKKSLSERLKRWPLESALSAPKRPGSHRYRRAS